MPYFLYILFLYLFIWGSFSATLGYAQDLILPLCSKITSGRELEPYEVPDIKPYPPDHKTKNVLLIRLTSLLN